MRKRGRPPYPDILTPREWEVLSLLREGLTNEQIAERLDITRHAVRYHVSEILSKLGVTSRQDAAAWQPQKARPAWMGAFAFVLWPLKHAPLGLAAKGAGAAAVVAAAGGIGFLTWGLVVTNRHHDDNLASLTSSPTAAATIKPAPTGTPYPYPSPFMVVTPRPTPTPDLYPSPLATITPTRTSTPIRDPYATPFVTVTPPAALTPRRYQEATPPITLTPRPTPTPMPDPRRTVEGTGTPSDCLAISPNPSEAAVNLGEPIRYARGIYSIGLDGAGPALLLERPRLASGIGGWNTPYQTYSVTADGLTVAFMSGGLYLATLTGGNPHLITTFDRQVFELAIAPDGEQVAVRGSDEKGYPLPYIVQTNEGAATPLSLGLAYPTQPLWSPNGDWLALAGEEVVDGPAAVYIVRPDGSDLRRLGAGGPPMAWSPDGSRLAFTVSRWEEGTGIYVSDLDGNVVKVSESVVPQSGIPSLTWSPDGRCLAFSAIGPTWEDPSSLRVLDVDTGWEVYLTSDVRHPAWSPDGSRIAFIRDGNLWAMNVDGSEQTRITNPRQPFVQEPAWLPDGSGLLFAFAPPIASSVYVANVDGTGEVNLADGYVPVFSPDGTQIAFYGGGFFGGLGGIVHIYVMDSDGRQPVKIAEVQYGDVVTACTGGSDTVWSPDGRFLAYGGNVHGVEIVPSDGSAPAQQLGGGGPSWAPDSQHLAFSSYRLGSPSLESCGVTVFDQETGQVSFLAQGKSPSWSPDGQRIAFYRDGAVYVIDVDGSGEQKLFEPGSTWARLAWSPDGSRLAVATDGLFVVDVASGESRKLADDVHYAPPSWSPDGTQLAFSAWDDPISSETSRVYIVSADGSGAPRKLTDGSDPYGSDPSWSPDGTRIAFAR